MSSHLTSRHVIFSLYSLSHLIVYDILQWSYKCPEEGKEREGRIIEDHKQDRTLLSPIIESALEFPSGSEVDEGLEGTDGVG